MTHQHRAVLQAIENLGQQGQKFHRRVDADQRAPAEVNVGVSEPHVTLPRRRPGAARPARRRCRGRDCTREPLSEFFPQGASREYSRGEANDGCVHWPGAETPRFRKEPKPQTARAARVRVRRARHGAGPPADRRGGQWRRCRSSQDTAVAARTPSRPANPPETH